MLKRCALTLLLTMLWVTPAAADSAWEAVEALNWKTEHLDYKVQAADSSYRLTAGARLLLGDDARRYLTLTQGINGWPDVVALIEATTGPLAGSFIDIEHHPIGFLKDEDWTEIAPGSLLQDIIDRTGESNEIRAENGFPTLEVRGWAQEPSYNDQDNTVFWATRLSDSQGFESINAIALKLGRHGYSKLTWTGDPAQFKDAKTALGPALQAYAFEEGARYADFTSGDAVATVGLGALAAGMMTGNKKAWAAGLFGSVLNFLKKFWYLLFLPLLAFGRVFKRT